MGITKAGRFSRKRTGGKKKSIKFRMKRAYERARPASNTKLGGRRYKNIFCLLLKN